MSSNAPHRRTVKMHHHPLGRVEGEGMSELDASHEVTELRTNEGCTGVSCVHVHPYFLLDTCREGEWGRVSRKVCVWRRGKVCLFGRESECNVLRYVCMCMSVYVFLYVYLSSLFHRVYIPLPLLLLLLLLHTNKWVPVLVGCRKHMHQEYPV